MTRTTSRRWLGRWLAPALATCVLAASVVAGKPGQAPSQSAQTPQLRRLSESEFRATIADVFGPDIRVSGRFEPEMRVDGLFAAGSRLVGLTPGGAEQYEAIARGIAAQVVDPAHRDRLVGCTPGRQDADGRACAEGFFARVGERLYRRPLQPAERALAVEQSLAAAHRVGDFHAGLAAGLAGMLVDLPFLFQVDRYVADPARPGRRTLDGWSRASRLSYLLWGTTPDERLLEAARSGALMTPAGLAAEVDRMTESPRFRDGGRAFLDDFLQLDGLSALNKDGMIYPAFRATVPAAAREQTLRTGVAFLFDEKGDYRDLFTLRRIAMNRTLSPLYRVPVASRDWQMVDLPANDPRAGLLGQISFLALHSHPGRTSPTLRGKALREIVMCQPVPAPPANVNFAVVQDTTNPRFKTTRERLQAHLDDEECASCHKRTDGIGLVLERFDGAGQLRNTENGELIDTSGLLDKAPVSDLVSLGQALHDHPAVPQCLVGSAWRFALGRPLVAADQPAVDALLAGFASSGYRLPDLFRAIARDPDFYAATPAPRPRAAALPASERTLR